ncbi:MAG: hypothetical protein D6815_12915 [Candidatus Dadabacteria bacterium]|nr:MAG: hypothetical protein D6815_12915 [Candidatus Dadabacteria bacterium]
MFRRVLDFIESGGKSEPFEKLALDVFAYQYERVELYRRFCQGRGATPDRVADWRSVPALPAEAFKEGGIGAPEAAHVFKSSGTTAGPERRSIHRLSSLDTYRASCLRHFREMVLADDPGNLDILVLGPTADTHPESSLGQMFSWCAEAFGSNDVLVAFDAEGRADVERAIEWLQAHTGSSRPVMILAITSALSVLLRKLTREGRTLRLGPNSRVVDTGGSKGRPGVLSPAGVLKAVWRCLHVPSYMAINEYGMTELLSQFYDDVLVSRLRGRLSPRAKVGPPWTRTTVVDPATLEPVPAGQPGLLRHCDLANWETVSFIQTLDLGRAVGAGFHILGRARGADQRGCSELLATLSTESKSE